MIHFLVVAKTQNKTCTSNSPYPNTVTNIDTNEDKDVKYQEKKKNAAIDTFICLSSSSNSLNITQPA